MAYLKKQGVSMRQIAKTIGRNVSTVKREIERNHTNKYDNFYSYYPHTSQAKYKKRISKAHNIVQFPLEVIQIIEQSIKETWSPEQIAAYYKNDGFPCYKTIYK